AKEVGNGTTLAVVQKLAEELDGALFLDTPRFREYRKNVVGSFSAATVRSASHAGGAYHDDPTRLAQFIDEECLEKAAVPKPGGAIRALCAPHMDLWRARVGYGHAYGAF